MLGHYVGIDRPHGWCVLGLTGVTNQQYPYVPHSTRHPAVILALPTEPTSGIEPEPLPYHGSVLPLAPYRRARRGTLPPTAIPLLGQTFSRLNSEGYAYTSSLGR